MGYRVMEGSVRKGPRKQAETPVRRSTRILSQAKPTASLLAAKKNAQQRMGSKKQASFSYVKDIYQTALDSKESVKKNTGIVFDKRMLEHECLWDPHYPECPERLASIINRCEELGLIARCSMIEAECVREDQLLKVHSQEILNNLKMTSGSTDKPLLENLASNYDSIYFHPSTYECSLLSAGSAVKLVDEICTNKIQNGVAFIRPPGHHASKNEYCGYSFFNNVAVAATHALSLGVNKILIVDWDVHHGQGTQRAFYSDPKVLYFSLHRYEHGRFWPHLRESEFDQIGEGAGTGFNFNLPLNSTALGDADYMAAFHNLILRVAYEFAPDLVLISAGFDSAFGDEKGEMEVTPACYAHLVTSLMSLASGKLAVILEGGYCIRSLAEGAALTLRALLGDPCPPLPSLGPPSQSMMESILNLAYVQQEYWKCLQSQRTFSLNSKECEDNVRKHIPRVQYKPPQPFPGRPYQTRDCYPVQSSSQKAEIEFRIDQLILNTQLLAPPHKVSFIFDSKMMIHKNFEDADHLEKPERISSIFKMHEEFDLLQRLYILKSRVATDEEILYAHSKNHLEEMKLLNKMSVKELIRKMEIFHSVYLHHDTFQAASLAAGSVLQVVESVITGESGCGVAVVRPPGHHADIDEPCGFCIFNSVAIAARYATSKYNLQRVLILDWDVHHGNGTQEIFNEDPNVLYMSIHRYDNGQFFPQTGDGAATQCGRGAGEGFNVNIPWNKGGMGNAEYVAAFMQVVMPVAYQFNPQLVLVSAGFDAAEGDPLGGCKLTAECFGHMAWWLNRLAGGKTVLCLEGGYNVHSISYAMVMCTKALLGDPLPPLREGLAPCQSAVETLREVQATQVGYWPVLCFESLAVPAEKISLQVAGSKNDTTLVCGGELLLGLSLGEEEAAGGAPPPRLPHDRPSTSSASSDNPPLTLEAFLSANLQALVNEEMYAVVALPTCPHLPQVSPVPPEGLNTSTPCEACSTLHENWTCLICYKVLCGRYINEHMLNHNLETQHPLTLSFTDLSVWCYPCQNYVDNQVLYPAKNAAHMSKFGTQMTWSYRQQQKR